MADRLTPMCRRGRRRTFAVALVVLLQGCTAVGPWNERKVADEDYFGSELSILTAHLDTMRALADSDLGEQVRIVDEARFAADATKTSSRRLRYALTLAVPGHPSSNSAEAYRLLTELLDAPDALLPSERRLARVQLADLRQRMILEAEVAELAEQAAEPPPPRPAAPSPPPPETTARLAELEEQNRQLASDLAEARAKLEAVMAIESNVER